MSDSVWPHRRPPTRLPRPWDSPGKNTGVGCHFLLQHIHGYVYITESLCCTPETNTTLWINYTSIKTERKKKEKLLLKSVVISLLCLHAQTHSIRENSPMLNLQTLSIKEQQINQKEKLSNFSFEIAKKKNQHLRRSLNAHHRGALQRASPSTLQGGRVFSLQLSITV